MNLSLSGLQLPILVRLGSPMTEDELLHFCSTNNALRIEREVNGDLLVMTPAGSRTSMINARICRLLGEWAEVDGGGIAFESNGGFTLPDGSVRAADAAWVSRSRWDRLTEEQQTGFAPICPEFVIELRSPTDNWREQERKMEQWIANGAKLGWLVDPQRKLLVIYRPGETPVIHQEPSSMHGEGPVENFHLSLAIVWQ